MAVLGGIYRSTTYFLEAKPRLVFPSSWATGVDQRQHTGARIVRLHPANVHNRDIVTDFSLSFFSEPICCVRT